ncbi:fumarylacetoacetate hydrolase family protein [Calderihabitans maritimus]|uniref:2-keto-4-pentenoate hydratase/2-oxohepta-3-ene-1,7-dioic acid hydratase n=1 Tax=Calderihabitans maritimus TaxID=1246530 RepID=A0A1Z5HNH9_9FIRM|nr:fumarylacetoacetate hydrolase family protein [Calderihabitans maritimus]GAW91008.1 2-keto-4-pentenoate hydratase/2-oxohepta-3-ene-1,7-dioic acid hydratase [Calderihabitans maritimus]
MQFVRFWDGKKVQYGILRGDKITAIEGSIYGRYETTSRVYSYHDIMLLAPCEPSKVICVGLNYRDHAEELNLPLPEEPVLFLKPPSTVIGHQQDIIYPPLSNRVDYEAELGVVIGETTHRVTPEEAWEKILGYTCANDVTARDKQPKDGQWTVAKSFDTFCPLGPVIATDIDPGNLKISLTLNGEVKQSSNTNQMIFPVNELVSYISQIMTLYPGDVLITGTPSGIGPMQPGDTVTVKIEGIGSLTNRVVAG